MSMECFRSMCSWIVMRLALLTTIGRQIDGLGTDGSAPAREPGGIGTAILFGVILANACLAADWVPLEKGREAIRNRSF